MTITIKVRIDSNQAIRRGRAFEAGPHDVRLTSSHLERLTEDERDLLASLNPRLIPDGLPAEARKLDLPPIIEPEPAALLEWIKRVAPRVQATVDERVRIDEYNATAQRQAIEQNKRELLERIEAEGPAVLVRRDTLGRQQISPPPACYAFTTAAGETRQRHLTLEDLQNDGRFALALSRAGQLAKELGEQQRIREAEQRQAKIEAKRQAEIQAEAERDAWVREHGSERLRKALELGELDCCQRAYENERLAAELPGWQWDPPESRWNDPLNPSLQALEMLEKARQDGRLEDVALQFVTLGEDEAERVGLPSDSLCVVARFLGRAALIAVEDRS